MAWSTPSHRTPSDCHLTDFSALTAGLKGDSLFSLLSPCFFLSNGKPSIVLRRHDSKLKFKSCSESPQAMSRPTRRAERQTKLHCSTRIVHEVKKNGIGVAISDKVYRPCVSRFRYLCGAPSAAERSGWRLGRISTART